MKLQNLSTKSTCHFVMCWQRCWCCASVVLPFTLENCPSKYPLKPRQVTMWYFKEFNRGCTKSWIGHIPNQSKEGLMIFFVCLFVCLKTFFQGKWKPLFWNEWMQWEFCCQIITLSSWHELCWYAGQLEWTTDWRVCYLQDASSLYKVTTVFWRLTPHHYFNLVTPI